MLPWHTGMVQMVVLPVLVCAWTAAGAAGDVRGLTGHHVAGDLVLDEAGTVVWRLEPQNDRGGRIDLAPGGGLVFSGHTHSEALATWAADAPLPEDGTVFETRFALRRPDGFYAHMLIISPRAGVEEDSPAYRIAYSFVGPGAVANNSTGFYLFNTGTEVYREQGFRSNPIAGARYRLAYDREYAAYAVVLDQPAGVTLRFYLRDTTLADAGADLLFETTDSSADRIGADVAPSVQIGAGSLIHPAKPVWFGGMKVYPPAAFDAASQAPVKTVACPTLADYQASVPQRTQLPNVFGSNMVLQQGKPIPVWGRGVDDDEITVSLAGYTGRTRVRQGRWEVRFDALPAGGPHQLTVESSGAPLVFENVMMGEVWVLAGQSNMSWWLNETTEAEAELPASNYPGIRTYSAWHPPADSPQFEVAGGQWRVVSPALEGRVSAIGYYFAKELQRARGGAIGLLNTSTPATGIETWLSKAAAQAVYGPGVFEQPGRFRRDLQDPSVFFYGKVAPVMRLGVAGILWYQGDGSLPAVGYAYRRAIPALIEDWRAGFDQGALPFFIVQIPIFAGCSPEMRESQMLSVLRTTHAGLAVTLDVGEADNIHPRHKRPVGERLALLARHVAYDEPIECMGPIYRHMEVRDGQVLLSFDHVGTGLLLKGAAGFEVKAAAGPYVPGQVRVVGEDVLAVWHPDVQQPVAVRYAWAPVPDFSLYNREGLLASPFRTQED